MSIRSGVQEDKKCRANDKNIENLKIQTMMENKEKMTFGRAYKAPDVQVTEVLVEHGFQASLGFGSDTGELNYGEDYDDFE